MDIRIWIRNILVACAALGAASCVKVNTSLGFDVVPESERYVTRHVDIPIPRVVMGGLDSLSGVNSMRMVVGSVGNETFGVRNHYSTVSLVPVVDTLRWGSNLKIRSFHFTTSVDSVYMRKASDRNIIQNVYVLGMDKGLDSTYIYSCDPRLFAAATSSLPIVSKGVPTINGRDSLSFNFTDEFTRKFIPAAAFTSEGCTEIYKSTDDYAKDHPAIHLRTDGEGQGGRINFLHLELEVSDANLVSSAYAELKFTADFPTKDGKGVRQQVDTSMLFCFGPSDYTATSSFNSFNTIEASAGSMSGTVASDKIYVDGGLGVKPMIEASHLRELVAATLADTLKKYNITEEEAFLKKYLIINRATVVMPYDMPSDWEDISYFPGVLNPTMRVNYTESDGKKGVTFAGLTDASVSTENQGNIFRDGLCYKPDMAFHMQQILGTPADSLARLRRADIWFLILSDETVIVKNQQSQSDYYNQMAYLNYYNQMMGGYGYGGYGGGYGGYNNNYYSYYMMQQLYASQNNSSSSTKTVTLPDTDRYYYAELRGPSRGMDGPVLSLTYSLPKF